jgi:hypothetical protein
VIAPSVNQVIFEAESLIVENERDTPAEKSAEWYAVNNLRKFVTELRRAHSKQEVLNASDILSRFAVETLEWRSELYKKLETLAANAREAAIQFS